MSNGCKHSSLFANGSPTVKCRLPRMNCSVIFVRYASTHSKSSTRTSTESPWDFLCWGQPSIIPVSRTRRPHSLETIWRSVQSKIYNLVIKLPSIIPIWQTKKKLDKRYWKSNIIFNASVPVARVISIKVRLPLVWSDKRLIDFCFLRIWLWKVEEA